MAISVTQEARRARIRGPVKKTNESIWNDSFGIVSSAIKVIHAKDGACLSFEQLYRNAYHLVLYRMGDDLYRGVQTTLTDILKADTTNKVAIHCPNSDSSANRRQQFLAALHRVWDHYTVCLRMYNDVLMYMNNLHCIPKGIPTAYEMGLALFRDHVVRSSQHPIRQTLREVLLYQVAIERDGEIIDRSLMRQIVEMLVDLGTGKTQDPQSKHSVNHNNSSKTIANTSTASESADEGYVYEVDFERPFLQATSDYYRTESRRLLDELDASVYMRRVEKRLAEERERVELYLHDTTLPKVIRVTQEELIAQNLEHIMHMPNSGLVAMVDHSHYEDLQRMYTLFAHVSNGLDSLRKATAIHIRELGDRINIIAPSKITALPTSISTDSISKVGISEESEPTQQFHTWVDGVLQLQDTCDHILQKCFAHDKAFQTSFNDSFVHFINENLKCSEYVSLYIDEHLKKGLKGKSEREVEQVLDKAVGLFRYLVEKDLFERYYKHHLAKRLLLSRSVSDEAERGMVQRLKTECGTHYTSKLEGMFRDLAVSNDLMNHFKSYIGQASHPNMPVIDLSVTVLTATHWPMSTSLVSCTFPDDVQKACREYEKFYASRHSGRKLTWQPYSGTADLKAHFSKRTHELTVHTYAMIILMLYNKKDSYTYEELLTETNINEQELKRHLQSLSLGRIRVLNKIPRTREVNMNDVFSYNESFNESKIKIKIATITNRSETEVERRDTQIKVDEERYHVTEAAIVRIMKSRKKLSHNELVVEVIRQLSARFNPSPIMIKKRIEGLIEREYLERTGDKNSYVYLP